jgi:hypothetical protein
MKKSLFCATALVFALCAGGLVATPPAFAKSDKDKAALTECKNLADPKAKDECVKQAGEKAKSAGSADKVKADKVKPEKGDQPKLKAEAVEKVKGGGKAK